VCQWTNLVYVNNTFFPKVLCVHLKRFAYNVTEGRASKIETLLTFSTKVTLAYKVYSLTSVACHRGEYQSGHYWAYVRQKDGSFAKANDNLQFKTVARDDAEMDEFIAANEKIRKYAYMLFYEAV
jgi:hypothetical protein